MKSNVDGFGFSIGQFNFLDCIQESNEREGQFLLTSRQGQGVLAVEIGECAFAGLGHDSGRWQRLALVIRDAASHRGLSRSSGPKASAEE